MPTPSKTTAAKSDENQFASSGRRVDGGSVAGQNLEANAAPGQIVHGIDQMAQVAPEPVELPYDQGIP